MSASRAILFRLATSQRLERTVRAMPYGERRAWRAASRYVAGTTFSDAARTARDLAEQGIAASIDQFGELVKDSATADRVTSEYVRLAREIAALPGSTWLSIDLSHLGLDIAPQQCAARLFGIAEALPAGRRIQVGAEDYDRAEAVLSCVEAAARQGLAERLGATVQANLHRSTADVERLIDAGVHIRLVKGAYVEPPHRAHPYGESTDIAFVRLAHRLAEAEAAFALATHHGVLREALLAGLGPRPVEQLLGVRPDVLDELSTRDIPVRVYVPFGPDWFRYWMRRVAESRGA